MKDSLALWNPPWFLLVKTLLSGRSIHNVGLQTRDRKPLATWQSKYSKFLLVCCSLFPFFPALLLSLLIVVAIFSRSLSMFYFCVGTYKYPPPNLLSISVNTVFPSLLLLLFFVNIIFFWLHKKKSHWTKLAIYHIYLIHGTAGWQNVTFSSNKIHDFSIT